MQNYLLNAISFLGPGLTAKAAQIIHSKNSLGKCSHENLILQKKEILKLIEDRSPQLMSKINYLSPKGIPGSLGQVHKGILNDGSEVAIKVQYPKMKNTIVSQFSFLLKSLNIGLKLTNKNFSYENYLKYFKYKLEEELNYLNELRSQNEIFEYLKEFPQFYIPKAYENLSNSEILVQDWVETIHLDNLSIFSEQEKINFANDLFECFIILFFKLKFIHGDFHYGNIGITSKIPHKIVLFDFGSMLKIPDESMKSIIFVLHHLNLNKEFSALENFVLLGFEKNLLIPLEPHLKKLWEIFLRPFLEKSFNFANWNFQEESQKILGKYKMNFRMAGPPWFLMLMRTFTGISSCFKYLGVNVQTKCILEKHLPNLIEEKYENKYKYNTEINNIQSKYLCIKVLEGHNEKVYLEMPARSSENLEDIVPSHIQTHLINSGYDLKSMQKKIFDNNFIPQILFETKYESQLIRVWLE